MNRMATLLVGCMLAATSICAQTPNISYPQSSYSFPVGTAISPLNPTNTGGPVAAPGSIGVVTTLAGSGIVGDADGTGMAASFYNPSGVAVDGSGNVYVADLDNNRIRKISPAGVVTTLAGDGNYAYVDGTGTGASFNGPSGVAVDGSGNVYVADAYNSSIRKISPAGVVTTLAGNGSWGYADGTGTAASFANPRGVAVDGSGNVYVAEMDNNRIRKISPAGVVTTLAGGGGTGFNGSGYADGTGTAASFNQPTSVAVDGSGNVYVADQFNSRIRKISPAGVVSTLAGGGGTGFNGSGYADGTGTAASFKNPSGVAVDGSGNVFVADYDNKRIRKISPAGVVTTLAGSGNNAYADGTGTAASFNNPIGVAVDGSGNVFVADFDNQRIRKISQSGDGYTVSPALPAGLSLDATTGVISGTPTVATPATSYLVTATNASGSDSFSVNITTTIPAPVITSFNPTSVGTGATVTITGTGFTGATSVSFGGVAATNFTVVDSVTITAVVGAGASGAVSVATPAGSGDLSGFTFLPALSFSNLALSPSGSLCSGSDVSVSFLASGFNSSNTFSIQLSNSLGRFAVNPRVLKTVAGTSGGSFIVKLPPALFPGGNYRLRVVASSPAMTYDYGSGIVVNARPAFSEVSIAPPFSQNVCAGSMVALSVPQNSGSQYQWMKDSAIIGGATNNNYNASDSGSYQVLVTNTSGCSRLSPVKRVLVTQPPVATFGDSTLPTGKRRLYALQASATYQWYLNGNIIPGAQGRRYTATTSGDYHLTVQKNSCVTTGLPVTITLSPSPRPAAGESVILSDLTQLSVYPNPSSSQATLLVQSEDEGSWEVRVMDIAGRTVAQYTTESNREVTMGALLAPGMYTIEATDGSRRMVQKWVKQ